MHYLRLQAPAVHIAWKTRHSVIKRIEDRRIYWRQPLVTLTARSLAVADRSVKCCTTQLYVVQTRSSVAADGPRDAMHPPKTCQLLYDSLGTSCTTNPEQIEVMELNGCSRPTCNKLCAFSYDTLDCRRCNPQARPSTSCADHTISLQWRIFLSPEFGGKVPDGSALIFGGRSKKAAMPKNKLYPSTRFDTIPSCDGRTGTRRQHIPRQHSVAR